MSSPAIITVTAHDAASLAQVRDLFAEYAEWLSPFVTRATIAEDLATLPEPFAPPRGRLIAACDTGGKLCGCVALKPHSDSECEIKRLFVRPECRGTGLGYTLFSAALNAACEIGYTEALVSTIPSFMAKANEMYTRLGFTETECFEDHTHPEVEIRYLRYDLADWCE